MSLDPEEFVDSLVEDIREVGLRANDFDTAGYLNSSVYLELFEAGRWQWARTNGLDIGTGPMVSVVADLHVEFLRPVLWDPLGSVLVRTAARTVTHYSVALVQSVEDDGGGNPVHARALVKLGLYDLNLRTIRPVRALFNDRPCR